MKNEPMIYTRFERTWHWLQALLVTILLVTGFEVHGSLDIFGFENAASIHDAAGWALAVLIAFAVFWHFTTGEWKQYVPEAAGVGTMVRYYLVGIFRGMHHPPGKTRERKLNPLQRIAYLFLKIVLFPLQLATGFLYLYHDDWSSRGLPFGLDDVAAVHTFFAFLFLAFMIVHAYLTTTGTTVFSNLRAMITGREEKETVPEGSTS